jgi:hypothetical protein
MTIAVCGIEAGASLAPPQFACEPHRFASTPFLRRPPGAVRLLPQPLLYRTLIDAVRKAGGRVRLDNGDLKRHRPRRNSGAPHPIEAGDEKLYLFRPVYLVCPGA